MTTMPTMHRALLILALLLACGPVPADPPGTSATASDTSGTTTEGDTSSTSEGPPPDLGAEVTTGEPAGPCARLVEIGYGVGPAARHVTVDSRGCLPGQVLAAEFRVGPDPTGNFGITLGNAGACGVYGGRLSPAAASAFGVLAELPGPADPPSTVIVALHVDGELVDVVRLPAALADGTAVLPPSPARRVDEDEAWLIVPAAIDSCDVS